RAGALPVGRRERARRARAARDHPRPADRSAGRAGAREEPDPGARRAVRHDGARQGRRPPRYPPAARAAQRRAARADRPRLRRRQPAGRIGGRRDRVHPARAGPAHGRGRRRAGHPARAGDRGVRRDGVRAGEPGGGPDLPAARPAGGGDLVTELLVREPVVAPDVDEAPPRRESRLRFFLRRPGLVVSVLYVALVVLAAFAPQVLAPGDPAVGEPARALQPPGAGGLFGTDYLGRDVYTRVVHGAALSLQATLIAVTVAPVVGGLLGVVAGFVRGWVDEMLMRVVDVLLAVPAVL